MGESEWLAEYASQFREDISSYLPTAIVDRAIVEGETGPLPPEEGVMYYAFCDPSSGLRKGLDSMAFAIAHSEGYEDEKILILDLVMEFQPPFSPEKVVEEIGAVCQRYNVGRIVQDRVSLAWIGSDFWSRFEIEVVASDKTKSQIYEGVGIALNKNIVELLDDQRLRTQILGLHRFVKSGGLIKIDHLGGHDDRVNAAFGALELALSSEYERPEIIVLG